MTTSRTSLIIRAFITLIGVMALSLSAKAQIQLYQLQPADSSWNLMLSNDSLGPVHNFPKYVPFDSLIPLENFYRKADSVCFRYAYQSEDRCFALPDSVGSPLLGISRVGDSVFISLVPGNTVAFRDSTRSDADISQIARDSVEIPELIVDRIVFGGSDGSHEQDINFIWDGTRLDIKSADYSNVFIGNGAGRNTSNTGTDRTIAIGDRALENYDGSNNLGIGVFAGRQVEGSNNVLIGRNSFYQGVGNNNVIIGVTSAFQDSLSGLVVIGQGVNPTRDNQIKIGDDTNHWFIEGDVGIDTDTPGQKLDVNGSMRLREHLYDLNNITGATLDSSYLSSVAGGVVWKQLPDINKALQDISKSGDTIFISQSNSYVIDEDFSGDYSDLTNQPNYTYVDSTNQLIRCQGAGSVDTTCYLEFDGVDDYSEAQNTGDLDLDFPMRFIFTAQQATDFDVMGKWDGTGSDFGQWILLHRSNGEFGIVNRIGPVTETSSYSFPYTFTPGQTYTFYAEIESGSGDLVMYLDGVEKLRQSSPDFNFSSPTVSFRLGGRTPPTTINYLSANVFSFEIGTEAFSFQECAGDTITGTEGTKIINNGASWGENITTNTACDTFPLVDIYVDSVWHSTDSAHYRLNNGTVYTIVDNDSIFDNQPNLDSLQAHLTRIIQNESDIRDHTDSLADHRTDIDMALARIDNHISVDNDLDSTNELYDDGPVLDTLNVHRIKIDSNTSWITTHIQNDEDVDSTNEIQEPYIENDSLYFTKGSTGVPVRYIDSVSRTYLYNYLHRNDGETFTLPDSVGRAWLKDDHSTPQSPTSPVYRNNRARITHGGGYADYGGDTILFHENPPIGSGTAGGRIIHRYGGHEFAIIGAELSVADTAIYLWNRASDTTESTTDGIFHAQFILHDDFIQINQYGSASSPTGTPYRNLSVQSGGKIIQTPNPVTTVNNMPPDASGNVNVSADIVPDTIRCIAFDGNNDRMEATSTSDLEFDLPIEIHFTYDDPDGIFILASKRASNSSGWWYIGRTSATGNFNTVGDGGVGGAGFTYDFIRKMDYTYRIYEDGGDLVQEINGVEQSRTSSYTLPGNTSNNFELGQGYSSNDREFGGLICYYEQGVDTFYFNECLGDTAYSTLGTALVHDPFSDSYFLCESNQVYLGTGSGGTQYPILTPEDSLYLSGRPDVKVKLPSGGGSAQTISRVGDDVVLSDGGGSANIEDDDADPTNEIPVLQPFVGSNLARLVPGNIDFIVEGENGIDVSSAYNSAATDQFTWTVDGSTLQTAINQNASDLADHESADQDLSGINERQELSIEYDTVWISFGGNPKYDFIKLPPGTGGDSLQNLTLEIVNDTAKIGLTGANIIEIPLSGSGGNDTINLSSNKVGNVVTVSTDHPGTDAEINVEDGDSDDTNELDESVDIGNNTSRLVPSYNDFKIRGINGIDVDHSVTSGASFLNEWVIDGSGISGSSPWLGSSPDPYNSSSVSTTCIGCSNAGTDRLRIVNNQTNRRSLYIDANVPNDLRMVKFANTRSGSDASIDIFGTNESGGDGLKLELYNHSGTRTISLNGQTGGYYTTGNARIDGAISLNGDYGTSGKMMTGGVGGASWTTIPSYTMTENGDNIDFKLNGVLQSTIDVVDMVGGGGAGTNIGASKTGTTVTLTSSTGTGDSFSVADNDNSSTNEHQDLGLSGNILSISSGNSVNLSAFNTPWTESGSGIYYNSGGLSWGTTSVASGFARFNGTVEIFNGNEIQFQNSGDIGKIWATTTDFRLQSLSGEMILIADDELGLGTDDLYFRTGTTASSGTIIARSSDYTMPSASGFPDGTTKTVVYTGSTGFMRLTGLKVTEVLVYFGGSCTVKAVGGQWYVEGHIGIDP